MKPYYVVLLMGAAALGGGLVVRYSDHPVEIAMARSIPPTVVAPPVPPAARVGPSSSVPVVAARQETRGETAPVEKPSALSAPEPVVKSGAPSAKSAMRPELGRSDPGPVMRVRIPAEPPAVIPLQRSVTTPSPAPAPVPREMAKAQEPAPAPIPAPPPPAPAPPVPAAPPAPEPNHATLKAGMFITIRVNEALSSNLNSKGDVFAGTLDKPLIADGFVIAERGAKVRGEVVESKSEGRVSELIIRLREVVASDGQNVHLVSEPWRKPGAAYAGSVGGRPSNIYDAPLTRNGAAVIRPSTLITFRLDQPVELTEKR